MGTEANRWGRTERLAEADGPSLHAAASDSQTRRERIPERLWRMAVDAAMVGGVSVTGRGGVPAAQRDPSPRGGCRRPGSSGAHARCTAAFRGVAVPGGGSAAGARAGSGGSVRDEAVHSSQGCRHAASRRAGTDAAGGRKDDPNQSDLADLGRGGPGRFSPRHGWTGRGLPTAVGE